MIALASWSDDEIALMRRGWNDDGLSAGEISAALAKQLGVARSRNAVLGFVHRHKDLFARRRADIPAGAARMTATGQTGAFVPARGSSAAVAAELGGRGISWSAREHKALIRLWNERGHDAGECAAALNAVFHNGRTAMSVYTHIQAHRADFDFRGVASAQQQARTEFDASRPGVAMADLGARDCRFPVNNSATAEGHLFCGASVSFGRGRGVYCAHHAARAGAGRTMRGEEVAA